MALIPVVETALAGREVIWGAPTYDQCRTAWDELRHAALGVVEFREARMEADFPGGGRVLFRSLDDPNNARSKTAHGVVMDEAAYCNPTAWHEVIRPILSDTGGWALMLSTPHGKDWFWHEWVKAQDSETSEAFQAPTLGVSIVDGVLVRAPHPLENPEFPFSEAQNLFEQLPLPTFKQEFLADFVTFSGQYFPEWEPATHLCAAFDPPKAWRRFGMLDYGYAKPFCYLQIALSPDGVAYVYRERYESRKLDTEQAVGVALDCAGDAPDYIVAGVDLWHKTGKGARGQSSAETYQQVWRKEKPHDALLIQPFRHDLRQADTDRLNGWRRVREWLRPYPAADGLSSTASLQVMGDRCPNLVRTITQQVHDELRPEDLDTDGEDHAVDALRYGMMSRPSPKPVAVIPPPSHAGVALLARAMARREVQNRIGAGLR